MGSLFKKHTPKQNKNSSDHQSNENDHSKGEGCG